MSCDCKKCVSAPQSGHCEDCVIFFESNNMAQSRSTMFYQDRMPLQIRLSVKFINLETNDCLHSWAARAGHLRQGPRHPTLTPLAGLSRGRELTRFDPSAWLT